MTFDKIANTADEQSQAREALRLRVCSDMGLAYATLALLKTVHMMQSYTMPASHDLDEEAAQRIDELRPLAASYGLEFIDHPVYRDRYQVRVCGQ